MGYSMKLRSRCDKRRRYSDWSTHPYERTHPLPLDTYLTMGSAAGVLAGVFAVKSAVEVLILVLPDPESDWVIFFFKLFKL